MYVCEEAYLWYCCCMFDAADRCYVGQEIIHASHKNLNVAEAAQRPKTGPGGLYNR